MIFEQKKLHEINEMADNYQLFLKENGPSEIDPKKVSISLKALYWQAGEQMSFLKEQIEQTPKNGKLFSMLIGFAYSILDGLEDTAERAMIGEKNKNGYTIYSNTNYIAHKQLFGKRKEKPVCDYEYFKFLRSFICAHPMKTDRPETIDGFIAGKYAICQYVDYIENNPISKLTNHSGADYMARILDDSTGFTEDIYIVSNEIWTYIDNRFQQLIDTIHSTIKERITNTIDTLKKKPIVELNDTIVLEKLDALIKEDWYRNGYNHTSLMMYKVALIHAKLINENPALHNGLMKWLWEGVILTRNNIQNMNNCEDSDFHNRLYNILHKIGFDNNQCNNFNNLNTYSYGADCDNYIEGELNNYSEYDAISNISQMERSDIYFKLQSNEDIKKMDRQQKIDIVSACYCSTNLPRAEISRLFLIIVLPTFVERYDLLPNLIHDEGYDLFIRVLAYAIDYDNGGPIA